MRSSGHLYLAFFLRSSSDIDFSLKFTRFTILQKGLMFLALISDLHHFRSWREGRSGDCFCDRFGLNLFPFPLLPSLFHLLITQTGASRNHLAISSSISLAGPSRSPRNVLDAHLMTISSLAHLLFLEMQICSASQRETTLPAVPGNYALVTWQEYER